ncbi:Rha family transcriptional regulator [Limosilactobacillus agrestis]|uniref:Rha family transcriptional regulator n=1 Tax=Limosilactobacillus agrestis TaxID=2759748 RepID=A0ABS8R6W2_9LACO|nr:Rha family transcriptional regulator [Limosilactobacillus agrestis]MCD7130523.1 Rha family transcriptional regulator [Limosilactobacillus agrestis]
MTPDILFNVIIKNRSAVVNSCDVAKVFHKRHKNILRDIDRLRTDWSNFTRLKSEPSKTLNPNLSPVDLETLTNVSKLKFDDCFIPSTYITKDGRTVRSFDMNRDGFTLLTMGFNGRDALAFKLAYINRFNSMEQELTKRTTLYDLEKYLRKQLTDTIQRYYTGDNLGREIMQLTNLLYMVATGHNAAKLKRDRGFSKDVSAFAEVLTSDERKAYISTENKMIGLYTSGVSGYQELKHQLSKQPA